MIRLILAAALVVTATASEASDPQKREQKRQACRQFALDRGFTFTRQKGAIKTRHFVIDCMRGKQK